MKELTLRVGGEDSSCFLPALAAVAQKKKTVASLGSHFS